MASVFLFLFASAYSWRTIVFHVFLLPHSSKKNVLSSSIYCANWPHLFDDFYPWTSSIFPSAVHCLDISPDFPGFLYCTPRKYPQSLSYGFNMHRVRRRAPERFRISSISAKARALAMLGVSQHLGGEDLLHPGLAVKPKPIFYPVSSGCPVSWDLEISGLLFPSFYDVACSNWQYCDICKC